jgi:hypothetical protein
MFSDENINATQTVRTLSVMKRVATRVAGEECSAVDAVRSREIDIIRNARATHAGKRLRAYHRNHATRTTASITKHAATIPWSAAKQHT